MAGKSGEAAAGRPPEVTYERVGAAAVLTIDRPERRNAVNGPTAERLLEGYRAFEADDEARVLVVTGAGGISFCAGADLKDIASFAGRLDSAEGPFGFTRLTPSKPTIAAIHGWCLAGGDLVADECGRGLQHVEVDEADVVERAVYGEVVTAPS